MNHAGHNSPNSDLIIISEVDVRVIWVVRLQHRTSSFNLVAFDGELTIDAGDDDLILVVGKATTNNKHIAVIDARTCKRI